MFSLDLGRVVTGGNSGFQAAQVAVQAGAKTILLLGFDMTVERGQHWHGPHPVGMANPHEGLCRQWRNAFSEAAPFLKAIGVNVINCTLASALTCFPIMPVEEALGRAADGQIAI